MTLGCWGEEKKPLPRARFSDRDTQRAGSLDGDDVVGRHGIGLSVRVLPNGEVYHGAEIVEEEGHGCDSEVESVVQVLGIYVI